MIINITVNEYMKIKTLFYATLKDGNRKCLTGVFYDHKAKTLVATNKGIIRFEYVDLEIDSSVILDERSFIFTEKQFSQMNNCQRKNQIQEKITYDVYTIDEEYPDYKKIIPEDKGNVECVALDLVRVTDFLKTFHKCNVPVFKFYFSGDSSRKLIKVFKFSVLDSNEELVGGIMPAKDN